MKKLFLLFALALGLTEMSAQTSEEPSAQGMNEIMVDPISLILVPAANINYERLLNKDSGIGINAIFGLGRDVSGFSQFSPYYRMYFGKKYASGFFVEGFVPITSSETEIYNSTSGVYYPTTEKITTVGIGVGFGGKWVVKRNMLFEVSGGFGRRFGDTDRLDAPVTAKGMLGIGYRF